jgi:hypothetical protein
MRKLLLTVCCLNPFFTCFGQTNDTSFPPYNDLSNQMQVPPLTFAVYLRGSYAVPPNNSERTGSGWFLLESNVLNFAVGVGWNFWPISAGIYGPAEPGQIGDLIFNWPTYEVEAPLPGEGGGGVMYLGGYFLSPEQVEQVWAGLWYVSVIFPDGEIRGQICPLWPESDCDGDGVPNKDDLCPNTPPGAVVDATGCSIAELVPCYGQWKDHKEYVKAVKEQAFRFWKEGRISVAQRNAIVKRAEDSTCGEPRPHPILP